MSDFGNTVFFIHTAEVIVHDEAPANAGVIGLTPRDGHRRSIADTQTGELTTKLRLNPNKHAWREIDNSADFDKEVREMLTEAGYNLDTVAWEYNRLDYSLNFLNENDYRRYLRLHGLMLSLIYVERHNWKEFYETMHKFTHEHQNIVLKDSCNPHRREYEYYNKPQEQEKQGKETEYKARFEIRECNLSHRKNFDTFMNMVFDTRTMLNASLDNFSFAESELTKQLTANYKNLKEWNGDYLPSDFASEHFTDLYTRNMTIDFFIQTGSTRSKAEKAADYLKSKRKGEQWLKEKDIRTYADFIGNTLINYCNVNFRLKNRVTTDVENVVNF